MRRAAYIIPGFSHRTSEPAYQAIAERFHARGIEPVLIDIRWRRSTIPGYIREAAERIRERPAEVAYTTGFSLGAMCLLNAAPWLRPRAQLLCSLMPLYAEDQPNQTWWMRAWVWRVYLGRARVPYPSFNGAAPPRTYFLYGEREERIIQPTVRTAREAAFPDSETIVIPGARHAIAHPAYLRVVTDLIDTLPD